MGQIAYGELKKLISSKMWLLIILGAVLPAAITWLSLLEQKSLTWQEFIHVAMLCFNVSSLLVFSTFAAFIWAREYEENTVEVTMCYPYPKHHFLTVKLMLMLPVIILTTALFAIVTVICGSLFFHALPESGIFRLFISVFLSMAAMHFLIIPAAFLAAILTRRTFSGIIWGIIGMCMCMTLYGTGFIQFLPPCIPFVLSDHLLGMNVMYINPNYMIHWAILGCSFIGLTAAGYFAVRRRALE